jgi:hypothetical protein
MKAFVMIAIILCGLLVMNDSARAQTWTQTGANTNYQWGPIASSADGTKLEAIGDPNSSAGYIFLSTNSGASWATNSPFGSWGAIASSADGTKLAALNNGTIYLSTNSGSKWAEPTSAPTVKVIASSADGKKLLAAQYPGFIYVSTNAGATWFVGTNMNWYWSSVTCSADGNEMAAVVSIDGAPVYVSTNCGLTWNKAPFVIAQPNATLAASADGSKLMMATSDFFYVSTNWGVSWASTNQSPLFGPIRSSANGSIVLGESGGIPNILYSSTNLGATWISNSVPSDLWTAAACSADGNKLFATGKSGSETPGSIWVLQTTPSLQLNFSSSNTNLNFSWLVPSTNMVLQDSPDLSNWAMVTNVPSLNDTNLQEQVMLPEGNGNGFFRLISQ